MISPTNSRIHITLSREDKNIISKLAKRDNVLPAHKASDLVRLALELEEDRVLGNLAVSRLKTRHKGVSLKKAWQMLTK
jgi:hypothetical protein